MIDIIELITKKAIYTKGVIPEGLVSEVEKITFFPFYASYNKGKNFTGDCYVVYFSNSMDRRIIPQKEVIDIGVKFSEEKTKGVPVEALALN